MKHGLQCRCGVLRGFVEDPRAGNHLVCYCKDCQAFAHFVGQPADILDERGGSEIVQTLPRRVTFTQGTESLACVRLAENGMVRWYASCCRTPIGNTIATHKMSFVGLIHSCLRAPGEDLTAAFGPIRSWVNTDGARGPDKPKQVGLGSVILWFLGTTIGARLSGAYKRTPFFDVATGQPVAEPQVLNADERRRLAEAVDAE